jgi:hypothetical protein
MTLDHAQRFGYHSGPGEPYVLGTGFYIKAIGNVSATQSSSATADARMQWELSGISPDNRTQNPDDGCQAQVERRLASPLVDTTKALADVMDLAFNHPIVQQRMRNWVTCMHDAGEAEYDEVDEPVREFWLGTLTRRETRIAVKDVKCTQQSRWADYYYAALADYEEQAIKANPQLFESALHSEQDRLNAIQRQ